MEVIRPMAPTTLIQEHTRRPIASQSKTDEGTDLSIIFVNWNSFAYLAESLESIYSKANEQGWQIIVVDNASFPDESLKIRSRFPDIEFTRSEQNLGFAGANNLGFQRSNGRHILFLNPDTRVLGSAVESMLARLKALPDAGVVGCKLLNSDGTVQTSCVQRFPTVLNQLLEVDCLQKKWPTWRMWGIAPLYDDSRAFAPVEVVSGACLMIRRDVFQQAGLFSKKYFMYSEDVDLCYQVQARGWRIYYTSDASVIHHGGGPSQAHKGGQWVAVMQRRAIFSFLVATRGGLYATVYRAAMAFSAVIRLVLLASMLPFERDSKREFTSRSARKWMGVLKWAVRQDQGIAGSDRGK